MPILPLKTPGLHYYLIAYNARGKEQVEVDGMPDGGRPWYMSDELARRLERKSNPVTDVFVVCHGWNTSAAGAHGQYETWMSAMADDSSDVKLAAAAREGSHFNPLLIGVQWPSKFGDMSGATLPDAILATAIDAAAGGKGKGGGDPATITVAAQATALAAVLDGDDAERLRADPAAAAALNTLAESVVVPEAAAGVLAAAEAAAAEGTTGGSPASGGSTAAAGGAMAAAKAAGVKPAAAATLPQATLDAMAAVGAAIEPLSEDEDDDVTGGRDDETRASAAFSLGAAAAQADPMHASACETAGGHEGGGTGSTMFPPLKLLLWPLSDVVFAAFQRRAAHLGRTAVHPLLHKLMNASGGRASTGAVKFHAIGHSLGCHMVCGAALGPKDRSASAGLPARLHSLSLLQAAVPTRALRPGGAYRRVVEGGGQCPIAGPVVLTHSASDKALSSYALMYGPPLGAVGACADLAPAIAARRVKMENATQSYGLAPGHLLSVEADEFVNAPPPGTKIDVAGSHMDITDDPVSHLVWEAVLSDVPTAAYAAVAAPDTADGDGSGGEAGVGGRDGNRRPGRGLGGAVFSAFAGLRGALMRLTPF